MTSNSNISTSGLVFSIDPFNSKSYNGVSNIVTDIVNGVNGTLTNGTTFSGKSFYFDGVNDYIDCGLSVMNYERTDAFSINYWVYKLVDLSTNMHIGKGNDFFSNEGLYRGIHISSSNIVRFQLCSASDTNNMFYVDTYKTIDLNKWYNISITYNGSSNANGVNIYINGINEPFQIMANSLTGTILNSNPLWIGKRGDGYYLNGKISQVSIYNRVLTPTEILQNYNATKHLYEGRIVSNGLIYYLDPKDPICYNGGTVSYDRVNRTPAYLTNGATSDGNSFYFDGVDDFIRIPGNVTPLSTLTIYSFDFWMKASYTGNKVVMEKGDNTKMMIQPTSGNSGIYYGDNKLYTTTTSNILDGTWKHYSVVQGSSTTKFYINGMLTHTTASGNSAANTSDIVLMSRSGLYGQTGNLSLFKIYNRTLTDDEVYQNYYATKNRFL